VQLDDAWRQVEEILCVADDDLHADGSREPERAASYDG